MTTKHPVLTLTLLTAAAFAAACTQPPKPQPPAAELSASAVDFGNVPCGAAASKKAVTLRNPGGEDLTFTAEVSGGAGFGVSPASGTVAPGESADLTVSSAVPGSSAAGATYTGLLTVATNAPEKGTTQLGLTAKAHGVTLALSPSVATFGVYPVNTVAPELPLTLSNIGTQAATVTAGAPADSQFSLSWQGAPTALSLAPGGSATLNAGFTAGRIQPAQDTATLAVAEPTCGGAVPTVQLTGQGTNGVVGFSTTDVYFGNGGKVDCGTQAASKTFTINNTGNAAFSWTATLRKGSASPFTFSPQSGTVPANGGSITITVNAAPIPAVAPTATDAFGDTLDIVTDAANDPSHPIRLHQTANGAVLSFSPTAVDFGLVPINNTSTAPLTVVNDGSASAQVTLTSDNARFSLSPPGPTGTTAGAGLAVTATFAPGTSVVQETANVSLSIDAADVLCAPLPSAMTLTGTGTNGSVSYSPAALDWGGVNCGTTAAAKTLTFTNSGNQAYTITPVLGRGGSSPFALAMSPDSGVAAVDGGTVVLTLTPSAIPQSSAVTPNLYGDTLTVTTDVTGDSAHDIPLRMTARGSIFAISTNALNFGAVAAGATASTQFTATNTGNAAGALNFTAGQPAVFVLPQASVVSPNSSASQNGSFSPPTPATYSDTANITVTPSTVLCQPLPFTQVTLAGVGTSGNVVALSSSSLDFGLTNCGATATARTLTVTNNSGQSLALALSLARASGSPYTVSGPATVATGATATITVTPKAIPTTAATASDAFADTLSVTASGGPVNETHTVALHQTAQGAVLTFNPTALSFSVGLGQSQSKNFTVNNAGNLPAAYTLAIGGTNAGSFSVTPTSGTSASGGSVSEQVTFSSTLLGGTGARSANIAISTSAVRCAPLPSALTLNGQIN